MKIVFIIMAILVISVSFVSVVPGISTLNVQRSRIHHRRKTNFTVALILPKIVFGKRNYQKAVNEALAALHKSRSPKFEFLNTHGYVQVHSEMLSLTPSPTGKVLVFFFFYFPFFNY